MDATFTSGTSGRALDASRGWASRLAGSIRIKLHRQEIYRETLRELDALTDRELEDLGLSRMMIPSIAKEAARRA